MKRTMKAIRVITTALFTAVLPGLLLANAPQDGDEIINQRAPLSYTPVQMQQLIDNGVATPEEIANNEEIVLGEMIQKDGQEVYIEKFRGTPQQYLDSLNEVEQELTSLGYSVQSGEEEVLNVYELYTDPEKLRQQTLDSLGMDGTPDFRALIVDVVNPCSLLKAETVINAVPEFSLTTRVLLPSGHQVNMEEAIAMINNRQKQFCSLGIDLFARFALPVDRLFFENYFQAQSDFFTQYDLTGFAQRTEASSFKKTKDYNTIVQEIEGAFNKLQQPGPEKLKALKDQLGLTVPAQYQIPDIPNLPSPIKPQPIKPQPIKRELKKRKDWSGFNHGSRDRFGTSANAFYQIDVTESKQTANAGAKAMGYVFKKEVKLVDGSANFYSGIDKVSADFQMKVAGMDVPGFNMVHPNKLYKKDLDYLRYNFPKLEYTYPFTIGPIPAYVGVGLTGFARLGYEVGLGMLKMIGRIIPGAGADAYANGAIGVKKVFSIGAQADLRLLHLDTPLSGEAAVKFLHTGSPTLNMDIFGDVNYRSLDGEVNAYVEIPIPKIKWCSFKIFGKRVKYPCGIYKGYKRFNKKIFGWNGMSGSRRIFNWGMEIGPHGSKLRGSLLDQNDRSEAQAVQNAVLLEQRQQAMYEYEIKTNQRLTDLFTAIGDDFNSTNARTIDETGTNATASNKLLRENLNIYLNDLQRLAE